MMPTIKPVASGTSRYDCFFRGTQSALESMASLNIVKVLCVGTDPHLLESRRMVLEAAGFTAACHLPHDAFKVLADQDFDIMILSVSVNETDRAALAALAKPTTRVIQLSGFISPEELLALLRS